MEKYKNSCNEFNNGITITNNTNNIHNIINDENQKIKNYILNYGISNKDDLEFFFERRNGGVIFFDKKKNIFIKAGKKENIKKELELHKKYITLGFQVPKIYNEIEINNYIIYTEEKIGEKTIGVSFLENNLSYNKGIDIIIQIVTNYLKSKKNELNEKGNIEEIKNKLHFKLFKKDIIESGIVEEDLINELFLKIENKLKLVKNFTLIHGDFNIFNIFEKGFIDIEDSYKGIAGYDIISLISHQYWFSDLVFSYEINDIYKILKLYETIMGIDLKENFDLLFILRGIWACAGIGDFPEKKEFRFNRMNIYIREYLNGGNILEYFLNEIKNVN